MSTSHCAQRLPKILSHGPEVHVKELGNAEWLRIRMRSIIFSEQEFSALAGPFKNLDFWMMGFRLFLEWFLFFVSSVVCMRYITEI